MTDLMTRIKRSTLKSYNLSAADGLRDNAMNTTGRGYEIFMGDDNKFWVVPAKYVSPLVGMGFEIVMMGVN